MNLQKIRGGNIETLNSKGYTIGVGLSLGNKWFTVENILESIKWALENSKNKVVVYVADSIHAINISVRSRRSMAVSTKMALEEGEELFRRIRERMAELKPEEQRRVIFVKWNDLMDDNFQRKLDYIRSKYAEPGSFQDTIHGIVRNHVAKENRNFSNDDIHVLGSYIVEELPECINRVPMKGIIVDAYMYPQDNEIVDLVDRIQKGEVFPEIKDNIMDTEPKVLLIVR